ncbi:Fe-Mn family superoxide dismutase [Patescibacteria group bacterium]|nr:Fe-Mn family superoxide dismutase [Patescibacteria group bacterium]MCG2687785.1 Fe-Mn family superoxide dismutase [Candidatus Parcubacteria bacterium]
MPNTIPYKQKEYPDIKNLDGISEKTTSIHHDKLYAGYVAKINEVREGLSEFAKGQKDLVGNQSFSELRSLRTAETFTTNEMDFGADRKAYIEAFWKNMDWHKANELFVKWKTIN